MKFSLAINHDAKSTEFTTHPESAYFNPRINAQSSGRQPTQMSPAFGLINLICQRSNNNKVTNGIGHNVRVQLIHSKAYSINGCSTLRKKEEFLPTSNCLTLWWRTLITFELSYCDISPHASFSGAAQINHLCCTCDNEQTFARVRAERKLTHSPKLKANLPARIATSST